VPQSIQKGFFNIVMRGKEDLISFLRKYDYNDIQVTVLDRTKQGANRAIAKAFAAKVDKALTGFQDSDVILVALTVRHKK
jgi:hypothetical protein